MIVLIVYLPFWDDGCDKGTMSRIRDLPLLLSLQFRGGTGDGMTVAASSSGVAMLPNCAPTMYLYR